MANTRVKPISYLDRHAEIPIAFVVERTLDPVLIDGGLGGIGLSEVPVERPWTKDYDAIDGEGPTSWAKRFDVTNWGLIEARDGDRHVGGAVVAFDTAGVNMLEGRSDLAALWDIRVRPEERLAGIGTELFEAAVLWARERGCQTMKVETQNINVPACRFYQRVGCTLGAINRYAYPDLPNEVELMWFKNL